MRPFVFFNLYTNEYLKMKHRDITIEDIKKIAKYKHLSDEGAEQVRQDIIELCHLLASSALTDL